VAVFNLGRIEQIGTPREIYESPATPFVAGFVGTSNVLDAEQSRRLLGAATMHSIRPERISIGAAGRGEDDVRGGEDVEVTATVLDVQYLGSACRVRTQLDDGSNLVANVPSDGLVGVTIGGSVRLAWPRSAAFPVAMTNSSEGGDQQ
jgi:putative spermidine/putrescine transport system ATP-binding protein